MSYLSDLIDAARARVEEGKQSITEEVLEQRIASSPSPRDFRRALEGEEIALIAEIKRASPARGALNRDLNAGELAQSYARGGAAAISVLTEPTSFQGSLEDLRSAQAAGLPVLRKDFVIDPWQVMESRAWGSDAVLLIAKALKDSELARLVASTRSLAMDAFVEVHDDYELERALAVGAELIGINHRDLDTFHVDPERTAKLAGRIPERCTIVSLSGVTTRAEIEELAEAGAHAVLVGESLVTSADPEAKTRELAGLS